MWLSAMYSEQCILVHIMKWLVFVQTNQYTYVCMLFYKENFKFNFIGMATTTSLGIWLNVT